MVIGDETGRSGAVDASEDFASSLFRFLAAVGEGTTEEARVGLITSKLSSVVHCPLAGIALVDDAGEWTIRLEIRGEPVDVTPALVKQFEPLYRLETDGPPLIVATREGGPSAPAVPPVLEALRVRRLAVVKLVSSRHELGVLFAGREAGRPFSPSERLALLAVAHQAAVGIENLRLNELLVRHSRSLERQNALILDAAGEGVYGLDTEGLTTFVNPAAAGLLGWGVGDLLGQPMHAVLHHTHADGSAYPPEECPIYAAFKDGQVHEVRDDIFWRQDGTSFPVEYTSTPIEEDGALQGAVVVFRDVTARKDAEAQLQVALEEVQALTRRLEAENVYLQEEIRERHHFGDIIGRSPAIGQVQQAVETVAPTNASVLITGESGTGKELVARAVHRLSPRRDRPLITVNCASVPHDLFESEFFGHLKGAFTGAVRDRVGRFQLAHRGTLFLDEVGEIPLELQAKLLRVLQEGAFERIGDDRTTTVDVRVVAATNRDMKTEVEAGHVREDLYYRLNVFPINVAPLRKRRDDIPLLAARFLEQAARRFNRPEARLTNANIEQLRAAEWPGNVRELMHAVDRAVLTARDGRLQFDLGGRVTRSGAETEVTEGIRTDAELQVAHDDNLRAALEQTGWKIYGPGGTAELLGMRPTTLTARIKKAGLTKPVA